MIDRDTIGRIAIRLGRAYEQAWCAHLGKDTTWGWDSATKAILDCQTKFRPMYDDDGIVLETRNMDWTIQHDECCVDFFDRTTSGLVAKVRLIDSTVAGPHISVYLHNMANLASMQNQLWRVDRAVASMSTDRWKPLYSLPPLAVIAKVFAGHLPSCPTHFYYVDSPTGPTIRTACQWRTEDEHVESLAFARRMELFEKKGGMKEWHKIRLAS